MYNPNVAGRIKHIATRPINDGALIDFAMDAHDFEGRSFASQPRFRLIIPGTEIYINDDADIGFGKAAKLSDITHSLSSRHLIRKISVKGTIG
jgi:hypothetical protein